ncbi:MAG: hypothetical protein AB8G05_27240 [Oligoflexales bacterium]
MYRRAKKVLLVGLIILPTNYAMSLSIVVGERLIPNNPWRNQVIKKQYEIAIKDALRTHKNNFPESKIKIVPSFDNGPAEGFKLAKNENAYGVFGYLYSMEANEAAQIAEKFRLPFITPVSPLLSVRNSYAFSMMNSFDALAEKMKLIAKVDEFANPSIIVSPKTYLANYEYHRVFKESFDVIDTISDLKDVIKNIEKTVMAYKGKGKVNILLSGFAFELVDLVKNLTQGKIAEKINIIAHSQWTYCPDILSAIINADARNFYFISDHFEAHKDSSSRLPFLSGAMKQRSEFSQLLEKESVLTGEDLNQPIVYVLRDMIAYVLKVAESSKDRNDFLRKSRFGATIGVSGKYSFHDGISEREVFLGKWIKGKIKPVRQL